LGLEGRGASRPERRVRRHCRSERQREDLAGPVHQRLPAPDAEHPSRRGHRGVAARAGPARAPGGLGLSGPGRPPAPGARLARLNHDQGMTIRTITHVMELVAEYARWVIVMHDGRVLLDGPPRQVFSRVEELRISAISPPPVARLGLILGLDPLPITVPEARDAILRRLSV